MRTDVTAEEVEFYRQNGFVAVEGFLTGPELEVWRALTEEAVARRLASGKLNNQGKGRDYYSKVFTQCVRLADTHEGMRKLIYDWRIGRMAATLAGIDGIRVWHDQALFKPAYGNPTSYHLDNPYWSFSSRDAISIWIALDDATLENGCMWYVPGTHRTARYDNAGIGPNMGDLFEIYPEWKTIEPVAVPAKSAAAVFHNGLTAHGAGANMTSRPRRAMTCAYMPDGSTFNGKRNVLPERLWRTLRVGDVLDDAEQNPLVWSSSHGLARS